jgi:excisionase family DNA binding protein
MDDGYTEHGAELLPIGETARALGVSVDTIRRWESDGKLNATRTLGNQRRFRRAYV